MIRITIVISCRITTVSLVLMLGLGRDWYWSRIWISVSCRLIRILLLLGLSLTKLSGRAKSKSFLIVLKIY